MATNLPSTSKYQTRRIVLCFSCCYILFLVPTCGDVAAGTETLLQGQALRDGEYLTSQNGIFTLEFFSPGFSKNRYLGVIHNPGFSRPAVWVANRDTPVPDWSVMLMIDTTDGLLKISYPGGSTTVSNSTPTAKNTSATILDNGNLVLRMLNPDGSIDRALWQSFDYPTDTLLPGMKLGVNLRTGHKWSLTSWISNEVPASGSFTLAGEPNGSSQLMIFWQGNLYWTSGLWDKDRFKNSFLSTSLAWSLIDLNFSYISNENEKYLTYSTQKTQSLPIVRMASGGAIELVGDLYSQVLLSCYGLENQHPGCAKEVLPRCRKSDVKFHGRRGFVEDARYIYDQNLSRLDCEAKCKQNCSCIAYTLKNKNGTGCTMFNKVGGFRPHEEEEDVVYFLHTASRWGVWFAAAVGGTLLLLSIIYYFQRKFFRGKEKTAEKVLLQELAAANTTLGEYSGVIDKIGKKMKDQVHVFSFESLEMATNNFSTQNKLGEGGFGSVYQGKLPSGQKIAIKRLSRSSGQGSLEFKNEILLTAKLQHDNLVKLLGCCIEGQEKILVYEFMPNRSLDFFLFNPSRRELIKWTNRINIVEGVAQGLLYLHKYSRLRVIHRDLKASNILLDKDMNPKISDFGMARIFGKQESEANTKRIVGTQGYMSPEYAIRGVFSMKSDVFSFGVLLLEIVSGKKNHGCYHSQRPLNLIGLAWELWTEGRAIELVDPTLDTSNNESELLRCINIGLLCVQNNATDRPFMTDVITMLTNESLPLLEPQQPAFFIDTSTQEAEKEVDLEKACTNDLSISVMEGR